MSWGFWWIADRLVGDEGLLAVLLLVGALELWWLKVRRSHRELVEVEERARDRAIAREEAQSDHSLGREGSSQLREISDPPGS
jgi:hypothetical protein